MQFNNTHTHTHSSRRPAGEQDVEIVGIISMVRIEGRTGRALLGERYRRTNGVMIDMIR